MEYKAFVVYLAALSVDLGDKIRPLIRAQIAHLKADKAPIKVASKYADFANVFLWKLAAEFCKHTGINNYTIKLVDNW